MPIKITQAARELHVATSTIFETLAKNGIVVENNNPNARINDNDYELLKRIFQKDIKDKQVSDSLTRERQGARKTAAKEEKAAPVEKKEPAKEEPKVEEILTTVH